MTLLVNGIDAASMRWFAPWSGVWTADIELQGTAKVTPSGRVVVASTEGIALVGSVDDALSGTFAEKRHIHVVGGGNGWGKAVRAQHYNSSVGLPLAMVATTTAAEVGEVVTVLAPSIVGPDFVRRKGAASQVFTDAGVDWWVGLDGVTRVGVRPPVVASTSLEILDWDPAEGTVRFTSSGLVEPGTVLVDIRFGQRIVRSVEALVSGGSVTGTLWVADLPPELGFASGLVEELAALAREATRAPFGRLYEYRVIAMAGDRVQLQAVKPSDGMPDLLPASVWGGISGYRATLTPSSKVLAGFIGGDPRRPYVAAYEPPEGGGWRPVKLELDAVASVEIGAEAAAVTLGEAAAAFPVVRATPAFIAWVAAVSTASLVPAPVGFASTKVRSS